MVTATELVNPDSGISIVAAAFFTSLFGMLGLVLVEVVRGRTKTKEAIGEVKKAAHSAEKAQENTKNVSNGFAERMDRKLDSQHRMLDVLATNQDRLEEMFTEHLSWHLNQDSQEREDE